MVDATGATVDNEAELVAASARFSCPLAISYLAVSVQDLMAADTLGRSVSLARPPNPTCDSHRIGLSTCSCRPGYATSCVCVAHGEGMAAAR